MDRTVLGGRTVVLGGLVDGVPALAVRAAPEEVLGDEGLPPVQPEASKVAARAAARAVVADPRVMAVSPSCRR